MISAVHHRRARLHAGIAAQPAAAFRGDTGKLEISGIDLFPVREPASGLTYSVLRVQTKSGLKGYGECAGASMQDLAAARGFWVGKSATNYAVAAPETALAGAVDMALLDLTGKSCNAPVYRLLGGPTRNKVRAMVSLKITADRSARQLESAAAAGYRAFGFSIPAPAARNQGQAYQIGMRKTAELVRGHGGDFVLEADGVLTPGDAASVAAGIQPMHPLWFDEPCATSNLETLHKIADESVVPLGFGRDIGKASSFQDLLRVGLVDIVRPDLRAFGLTQTRRIAAMAETYYVAVAPRHTGGPIATAAALQLAASLPNFFIQSIPFTDAAEDRSMRDALAGSGLESIQDGFAHLPKGAGLGITVDERILEKYRAA